MRSAAQGEQAGCGLAKEEAAKGLFFLGRSRVTDRDRGYDG
jgi:hypothetical protein